MILQANKKGGIVLDKKILPIIIIVGIFIPYLHGTGIKNLTKSEKEYIDIAKESIKISADNPIDKILMLNIKVGNIEPSFKEQFDYLLSKYEKNDVLAMYLLRQIIQNQREAEYMDIVFYEYINNFTRGLYSSGFPIEKSELNTESIVKLLKPYIGFEIDNSNWKEVKAVELVYKGDSIIHTIYEDTIKFRDDHSIKLIKRMLKEYNKVFIMMGADHIKNQEERLRKLFYKKG